jgi:hypothetical protein
MVHRIIRTYQCVLLNILRLDSPYCACSSLPNWNHFSVTQDLPQVYKNLLINSTLASRYTSKPVAYIDSAKQTIARTQTAPPSITNTKLSEQLQQLDITAIPFTDAAPGTRLLPYVPQLTRQATPLVIFTPQVTRIPNSITHSTQASQPHVTSTQPPDSDDD